MEIADTEEDNDDDRDCSAPFKLVQELIQRRLAVRPSQYHQRLSQKRNRILVVRDKFMSMYSLCSLLQLCNIDIEKEVDLALNGKEAVETVKHAQKCGMSHRLILLDLQLPVSDGIDAAR